MVKYFSYLLEGLNPEGTKFVGIIRSKSFGLLATLSLGTLVELEDMDMIGDIDGDTYIEVYVKVPMLVVMRLLNILRMCIVLMRITCCSDKWSLLL